MEEIFSNKAFRQKGHELIEILADYLEDVTKLKQAIPWQKPEESLAFWEQFLDFEGEKSPIALMQEVLARSVKIHHPRYMGHQVGMVSPTAALAGLFTGLINNGMAVYEMGISGVPLEVIICRKFAQLFGLPDGAQGFMTSGGTLANVTAMLTARQIQAKRDVWTLGQQGQKMAIMVSQQAHYCMSRAAQIMGWGEDGIIKIPCDQEFRIRTDLLEDYFQSAQKDGIQVIALVGSACTTAVGAFDDLKALGDFAAQKEIWFHVDAAHGGPAILSHKYKSLLNGIEKADSITIDFHKMMMVPALCSALIYRNNWQSAQTFAQKAEYLLSQDETLWHNPAARTFECSKLMMSVKVAAIIQEYGLEKIGSYVQTCFDNGQILANMIAKSPDFELATQPQCNIVCFRFVGQNQNKNDEMLNDLNEKIREQLLEKGEFYVLRTIIEKQVFLRVSLMNVFSGEKEFQALLEQIRAIASLIDSNPNGQK
jgi:L-2,4-diaminobutyrate decarboxylase